jgi:hypothetical protein
MGARRDKSDIIAGIDYKIAYHEGLIQRLHEKKEKALSPIKRNVRKTSMNKALIAVKEAGLTPDEIITLIEKKKKAKAIDED